MFSFRPASGGILLACALAVPVDAASPRGYPASPQRAAAPAVVEHRVARGETLWSISQRYHTSVGAIMDYNRLPDHFAREGVVLRIPPHAVETGLRRQYIHVVKRGEDFWSIAERYKVSPALLGKANPNVNPNRIHEDMELVIPASEDAEIKPPPQYLPTQRPSAPALPPASKTSMIQHTIAGNDTFYSIGKRYGVPMEAVVAANPSVRPERLRAGMKVWVPVKGSVSSPPRPAESPARYRGKLHKVKEDESIASIAKKYGVREADLLRENGLREDDVIYVDDDLKIPGGGTAQATAQVPSKTPASPQSKPAAISQSKPPPPPPSKSSSPPSKPSGNHPSNTVGDDGSIRSYIVSAGENENTICDAFGITKQQLFEYNRLSSSAKLKPGDEIAIPRVAKGKRR